MDELSDCRPTEPVCHPCLMSLGSVSALEQHLINAAAVPQSRCATPV